ncbi:hypothetical protein Slin14017_G100250 [Septoria linicola]|nr:hypothetical protein Slin14017_G100250 [Septoria linicola]
MPRDFDFQEPPLFNINGHDSDYDTQFVKASKKNGNLKSDKHCARVETAYEGCTLQKAVSRIGEDAGWSCVGQQLLPVSDSELSAQSRKLHKKYGDPTTQLSLLSPDQRGVVLRYVEKRQRQENEKNAEWILAGVERIRKPVRVPGAWTRSRERTDHITVIVKRQDRNAIRGGTRSLGHSGHFAADDIIDLEEPLAKNKAEKNKSKKAKIEYDNFDDFAPPYIGPPIGGPHDPFAGLGRDPSIMQVPPPPPPQPMGQQFPPHPMPPPPPGGIPIEQFPPPQHHVPAHPFEPHPQFGPSSLYANDSHYPMPTQVDPMFQARRQTPIDGQRRSRSYSREGRRESRDRRRMLEEEERRRHEEALRLEQEENREEDRRQQQVNQQRTERKIDELMREQQDRMQELTGKFAELGHNRRRSGHSRYSTSSDGSLYRDNLEKADMWSLPSGGSFTPPSTPGQGSPILPNGTLGRTHSKHNRDVARGSGYPIERRNSSNGYRRRDGQTVMEPYVNNTPHGLLQYRHVPGRNSFGGGGGGGFEADDYPRPPAPMPPTNPGRRHRAQVHQRAATYDVYPSMPALPEFSGQEFAEFNNRASRSRRRGTNAATGARRDEGMYAYAAAVDDGRAGRRADRGVYM